LLYPECKLAEKGYGSQNEKTLIEQLVGPYSLSARPSGNWLGLDTIITSSICGSIQSVSLYAGIFVILKQGVRRKG
jgi:hypothetical protein